MMMEMSGRGLTWLRTLGRGASGAVVSLFAAGEGELVAVKSAASAAGAEQLRREGSIMASLRSPHVLRCLGFRRAAAAGGEEYQLILEFAPGGSLADEAARNGGRLGEPALRAFAADVARGLAYLHDEESTVHGDVKARNVVIDADGRAKLADFGCARRAGSNSKEGPIGGTPAFMAPEVARGEEQGPAADVWALGCTVIELATGRAPWSDVADDVFAAVRMIGYTDAVPAVPEWLSAEAKDFLDKCLSRDAGKRWTAARLLEHPFLQASAGKAADDFKAKWVSPKSTLDAALWESDADDEDEDDLPPESPADRIRSLAGPCSALPEWESDDGWIEVCSPRSVDLSDAAPACSKQEAKSPAHRDISDTAPACSSQEAKSPAHGDISAAAVASSFEQARGEFADPPMGSTAAETTTHSGNFWGGEPEAELFVADLDAGDDDPVHNVGAGNANWYQQQQDVLENFAVDPVVPLGDLNSSTSDKEINSKSSFFLVNSALFLLPPLLVPVF